MADIINLARARQSDALSGLTDEQVGILISAASASINRWYNIVLPVTEDYVDVEEACIHLMVAMMTETTAGSSERLGDYSFSATSGFTAPETFPFYTTMILEVFKKAKTGPVVGTTVFTDTD